MRIVLSALLVFAVGCGATSDSGGTPAGPNTNPNPSTPTFVPTTSVALQGSAFAPPAILVAPGATVTFTNQDGFNHNVTFDGNGGPTPISNWSTGTRTATMPTAAATYTYRCTLHAGMTGSVKVQ